MTYREKQTAYGWLRFLFYRLKYFLAQWIDFKAPVHIDIELNSSCNLKCPICHQSDEPRVYDLKKMSVEDVKARLDEAKKMGVLSFKPNWRGEALIHSGFWEVLDHALKLDFTDILINTNLSVKMTEDQIQKLSLIPSIKVSIDSITNYKEARRGGDLDLVMSNIVRLFRYRDELHTNRHESNLTESFDEYRRAFFVKFCEAWNTYGDVRMDMVTCFDAIKMHNGTAKTRNHLNVFIGDKAGDSRKYCGMPSRRLLVSATTGKIYPCCVPYAEPDDMAVGKKTDSLKSAWTRAGFFRKILKKNVMPTKTCINCVSSDAWR